VSKEAMATVRARADRYFAESQGKGVLANAAGDLRFALNRWEDAMATTAEERAAWDRYAAVAMADDIGPLTLAEFALACGNVADAMLVERRKRFGGGA
jgi:hypothetical protein